MASRRTVLAGALAAGVTRFVCREVYAASDAEDLFAYRRYVLAAVAFREYEVFTGPFPVDDQFEVTYYYLEEHDDGFLSVKGELRNRGLQPARPNILNVHVFDEHGVERGSGPQDDIEDVVLPGQTTPFWAFWSQELPLSELGSIRFERGADSDSRAMEAPPVTFEGPTGDHLIPGQDQNVGQLRNTGDTLLNVGYKIGYYSPDDVVLWIETSFKEPIPPGGTLPVRVTGQDSARSPEISPTLAGLDVDPHDAIAYRVFAFVE